MKLAGSSRGRGDISDDGVGYERGGGVDQAVGGDGDALVVAV